VSWVFRATAIATAASACAAGSCSAVSDPNIGIEAPPDSVAEFGPVGDYLDHRCGTLDCHGSPTRNLRIWGCEGMRLAPSDVPFCSRALGGSATTSDEYEATYRSLVGLEPDVMSSVVASHGANPDLLTFVRKARGLEAHKGGVLITAGDPQDQCITSWLAGQTNVTACTPNAISYPQFPIEDASAE
jgi:hypothetical protein